MDLEAVVSCELGSVCWALQGGPESGRRTKYRYLSQGDAQGTGTQVREALAQLPWGSRAVYGWFRCELVGGGSKVEVYNVTMAGRRAGRRGQGRWAGG